MVWYGCWYNVWFFLGWLVCVGYVCRMCSFLGLVVVGGLSVVGGVYLVVVLVGLLVCLLLMVLCLGCVWWWRIYWF